MLWFRFLLDPNPWSENLTPDSDPGVCCIKRSVSKRINAWSVCWESQQIPSKFAGNPSKRITRWSVYKRIFLYNTPQGYICSETWVGLTWIFGVPLSTQFCLGWWGLGRSGWEALQHRVTWKSKSSQPRFQSRGNTLNIHYGNAIYSKGMWSHNNSR